MRVALLAPVSWTVAAANRRRPGARRAAAQWRLECPVTDFNRYSVPLDQISSGGPTKDGIPSTVAPPFCPRARRGCRTASR
jgi:hypothetical protein